MWIYFIENFFLHNFQPCQQDDTTLSLTSNASFEEQHERNWKIGFPMPLMETGRGTFFFCHDDRRDRYTEGRSLYVRKKKKWFLQRKKNPFRLVGIRCKRVQPLNIFVDINQPTIIETKSTTYYFLPLSLQYLICRAYVFIRC